LWFIGIVAVALAALWVVPLFYDMREANKWRTDKQEPLLEKMIDKAGRLSVEEIRQIVSAMNTQPRGTQGLTRSLLALIIASFIGIAMVATLLSGASDSSDLRKTIVTALLSILATISGFYFGARTAQSATEQATRPPESPGEKGSSGPAPVVTQVDPVSGPGGQLVTVKGSGLTGATAVNFGSVAALDPTVMADDTVTVKAPSGQPAGTVSVSVTTPGGTSTPNSAATYQYQASAVSTPSPVPGTP
jgi:hypothetical protein